MDHVPNPREESLEIQEVDASGDMNTATSTTTASTLDDRTGNETMPPPAAPTKPQLRRRRVLFEKLRTKRQQIISDHIRQKGDSNTNDTSTSTNEDTQQRQLKPKKPSLVANYYRVDTVPPIGRSKTNNTTQGIVGSQSDRNGNGKTQEAKSSGIASTAIISQQSQHEYATKQRNPKRDKVVNVILPGVPSYEEDWARDTHDYFNLIILVPVTVLNIMNWNWDILLMLGNTTTSGRGGHNSHHSSYNNNNNNIGYGAYYEQTLRTVQSAWTGDWFELFFYCTAAYFIIDLLWIVALPICVKSPSVIIQHHIAVLLYIIIPYIHPNVRYCMGACMTVEINTWFLIARRVFNKQGFPPWTLIEFNSWLSIRVKVISIFFYLTWISIRCILYPALLVPFYQHWKDHFKITGSAFNLYSVALLLHAAFCLLNLKWSYELLMSKIRYFRRQRIMYQQHLRQNRNSTNSNGKSHQYQYQPDPSISQGL
jgi:TLC domain